ncbi:hypothetical protein ACFW6F_32895 [Streptomyces sp. NPDC058746]|uniref:hypothetical protein n=1 Tax=Streptomyces sp. NPDC058746 TaxID=3346622 RepID=UPI00369C7DB0
MLLLRNFSGELEPAIRTDRGDTDAGAAMIARAEALVGRRVLVYKEMEALASNPMHKARVVLHLMDLGPETESFGEDEAKGHVLQAADGDKELALRAWHQVSLPDRGPVTAPQLGSALTVVQQLAKGQVLAAARKGSRTAIVDVVGPCSGMRALLNRGVPSRPSERFV